MKFSNLSRRISQYSSRSTITQEDVLSLMSILCDDIRFEGGVPVDRCPVEDWDQFLDELYALSYTINTLYHSHRKTILELEQSDTDSDVWQQLQDTQAACQDARERLHQADGLHKQLRRQEEELREQLSNEREKQAEAAACRDRIVKLEAELETLRNTDLQPLMAHYSALEQEQAQKQELLKTLLHEKQQKEQELTALRTTLQSCQDAAQALEQERDSLQRALETTHGKADCGAEEVRQLRQQLREAENAAGTMTTEYVIVKAQLDAQLVDNTTFREEKLVQAQTQLNEAKAEAQQLDQAMLAFTGEREQIGIKIAQTATLIEAKKLDLEQKKKQFTARNTELEQLNNQISAVAANLKPLLDEINMRKEQLEGMDREQIEADLRRDLETWQAQIAQLERKQVELGALQEQISQKASLIASEQEKADALQAQLQTQNEQFRDLSNNVEALNQQLSQLQDPEHRQRIAQLQRQMSILQQLRSSLEQGNRAIGCGWNFQLSEDLDQRLSACAQSLKDLEKAIRDHAALWQAELTQ